MLKAIAHLTPDELVDQLAAHAAGGGVNVATRNGD